MIYAVLSGTSLEMLTEDKDIFTHYVKVMCDINTYSYYKKLELDIELKDVNNYLASNYNTVGAEYIELSTDSNYVVINTYTIDSKVTKLQEHSQPDDYAHEHMRLANYRSPSMAVELMIITYLSSEYEESIKVFLSRLQNEMEVYGNLGLSNPEMKRIVTDVINKFTKEIDLPTFYIGE